MTIKVTNSKEKSTVCLLFFSDILAGILQPPFYYGRLAPRLDVDCVIIVFMFFVSVSTSARQECFFSKTCAICKELITVTLLNHIANTEG